MIETERPKDFLEHMRTVTLAIIESKSGSDELIDIDIFMGEVIEPSTQELASVLKYLKDNKVVKDLAFDQRAEDFLGEDDIYEEVYVAYATCKVIASEYKKLATQDSLYPRMVIKMREANKHKDIVVNNEFILAKPQDAKKAYFFWKFILKYPNKVHRTDTIKKYAESGNPNIAEKLFSPNKIVDKYGFTSDLRKLVFPISSLEAVHFRNPIFQKDVDDSGYSESQLAEDYKKLKPTDESKLLDFSESQSLIANTIESRNFLQL